jgi:hypothetical protein
MGRCTLGILPLPSCQRTVNPREPSTEARLPLQQKPYCEAPTGVADPITTWSSELDASTQEGG